VTGRRLDDLAVELPDDRRLAYTDVGDPQGSLVFYFHGNPGSRLECASPVHAEAFSRAGLRLVSADRPGFGRSDPKRGRRAADWPSDVVALADRLAIDRFAVLGYSRGGLYALACAALVPDRITAVGTLSAAGPPDMPGGFIRSMPTRYGRLSVTLAKRAPRLARSVTRAMRRAGLRDPSVIPRRFKPLLTAPADREILRTAGTDFAARALLEATRQGPYETVAEQRTMLQPPGFRLEDVTLAVTLWHGEQDSLIPISHSKELARRLPTAKVVTLANVGHLHNPEAIAEIASTLVRKSAVAPSADRTETD